MRDGELRERCARILSFAAVAQLDRVLGYEPRGRGFNSCQPHHIESPETLLFRGFFFSKSAACGVLAAD